MMVGWEALGEEGEEVVLAMVDMVVEIITRRAPVLVEGEEWVEGWEGAVEPPFV